MVKGLLFDIGGTIFTSDKVEKENKAKAGEALLKYFKLHGLLKTCKMTGQQVADAVKAGGKAMKE
jgi:hypothetical protein